MKIADGGPARMPFALFPLSKSQLEWLAASREPEEFQGRTDPGSMPPSFVAARSLKMGAEGKPEPWSTTFLVVRDEDAQIVGACGFKTAPSAARVEVGYGVSPVSRGRGAATKALKMLSVLAFEAGASEVLAEVLPENEASIHVLQKAGFVQIGTGLDEEGEYVIQWLLRNGT